LIPVPSASTLSTADDELTARAAWLHYAGGLKQSEVAERLGIAPTRAHRLIASAVRNGLVRVFVDCDVASCLTLEQRLYERYGLDLCEVVPDVGENPALPLHALGRGGGRWLMRVLESSAHPVIGVGHGRTLAAVVDALPRSGSASRQGPAACGAARTWVSLLGGLTRKFAANPYDVVFRVTEKVGADAYFMPAPMFVDSPEDRALMLGQTGLAEIMQRIDSASLCLLGIGATEPNESLALGTPDDDGRIQAELHALGVVAELLGQFLDADGALVATRWDLRMMAPTLATLAGREVVAVAGGLHKRTAIRAALRSGHLTGLITDEATAQAIVDSEP